jgi:hypothetical protein
MMPIHRGVHAAQESVALQLHASELHRVRRLPVSDYRFAPSARHSQAAEKQPARPIHGFYVRFASHEFHVRFASHE